MIFINEEAIRAQEAYNQLQRLAQWVQLGMMRQQVEWMFPNSRGGIQGAGTTIYPERPGVKVEIAYDGLGWPGRAYDRVTRAQQVFLEPDYALGKSDK